MGIGEVAAFFILGNSLGFAAAATATLVIGKLLGY